jgi:hypothetical protein
MLNQAYNIQKFSENLSKINKMKQFIELVKDQTFDIEIDFVHRTSSILTWFPINDSFSGNYNLLVYPKIKIDEKNFAPRKMIPIQIPSRIGNCETAFLEALKRSICDVQQVWI